MGSLLGRQVGLPLGLMVEHGGRAVTQGILTVCGHSFQGQRVRLFYMNLRDEAGIHGLVPAEQDSCKDGRETVDVICLDQRIPPRRQYLGGVICLSFLDQAENHILVHFYISLSSSITAIQASGGHRQCVHSFILE